jgi:hypothetical protein
MNKKKTSGRNPVAKRLREFKPKVIPNKKKDQKPDIEDEEESREQRFR